MINDIVHQYWPMCANEQYRQFTATCPYILDTDIPPFYKTWNVLHAMRILPVNHANLARLSGV